MKYKIKKMIAGSKPNDNGYLSKFSKQEMIDFINKEPKSKEFFKQIIGGREFLYNTKRYCLWLKDCSPKQLKEMPLVVEQIKKVKDYRLKSSKKTRSIVKPQAGQTNVMSFSLRLTCLKPQSL